VTEPVGERRERDWNAELQRLLAPLRSEAAAFRVLLVAAAVFALFLVVVLLVRAVS
jgi:hypothetical protein